MAKNLVEYQLADGSPVYVEEVQATGEQVQRAQSEPGGCG